MRITKKAVMVSTLVAGAAVTLLTPGTASAKIGDIPTFQDFQTGLCLDSSNASAV